MKRAAAVARLAAEVDDTDEADGQDGPLPLSA